MISEEDMPSHWQWKEVGDLCETINGYAFDSSKFTEDDGGLPIVRIRDLDGEETEKNFIGDYRERYLLEGGELLISMDGHFDIYKWRGGKALQNQRVCRLTNYSDNILKEFLRYYLSEPLKNIEEYTEYTTVKHLSAKKIRSIEIPVPPIEEQRAIVKKLDEIFESIGEIQDTQEQAEEIKETLGKSTYKSLFDGLANQYDLVEVEEISEEIKNGGTPKRSNDDYWGGDIPWLKSGELNEGYLSTSEEGLTEEGLSSGSAKLMEPKTVLIAMYGATRGKTAILEKEMTTNQAICGVLVNEEKIIPEFLQLCIKAKKRELVGKGRGGGQDNINQTTIKETKIPLPPLEVQEEILEKISDIEELLEKDFDSKRKKITEDLPKSVLAEAFKGNLVDFGATSESDELGSTEQGIDEKQESSFDGEGQQSLGEYR